MRRRGRVCRALVYANQGIVTAGISARAAPTPPRHVPASQLAWSKQPYESGLRDEHVLGSALRCGRNASSYLLYADW